jgi:PAS domain S-box-containing protein
MKDFREQVALGTKRHSATAIFPIVLLALGLFITGALSLWGVERNRQSTADAMVAATQQTVEAIEFQLQRYQYGLHAARGAALVAGEHTLTSDQFKRYSDSRNLAVEFPGAQGFGFIRRVPESEESAFIAEARLNGTSDFSIHQLSAHQEERYVIQYVEPLDHNRQALGLDIASEPNRREAAQSAMNSGEARLTAPITLVQSTGVPHQSFLFLMPIYRTSSTPTTVAERVGATYGWVYAILNIQSVLSNSGLNLQQAKLTLKDLTTETQPDTFYSTATPEADAVAIDSYSTTHNFNGRVWKLTYSIYPHFSDRLPLISVSALAIVGVLMSAILAVLAFIWSMSRLRRRDFLEARLRLAAVVESSHDCIIFNNLNGIVMSWNSGAEQLFGYTVREALGRSLSSLIRPPDVHHEEVDFLAQVSKGQRIDNLKTWSRRKDEQLIPVSISVSPIYDSIGCIVGASTMVRDISLEKAAEAQVLETNARLEHQVMERTAELEAAQRAMRMVLDGVPSMIGYWDAKLINRVANHAYLIWFGVDPLKVPGRSMRDVLGAKLFEANRRHIEGVLRGEPQTFEREIPGPYGRIRHSLTHYIPDISEGGVKGFFVIAHDVTELNESKTKLAGALRENELLLSTINEQLLYSATDPKGVITDVNEHFCSTHGFTRAELLGHDHKLLHSGMHPKTFWQEMWADLHRGTAWRGDICNRARDGSLHWFDTFVSPSFNAAGAIERYIALRIDITSRRAADEEVSRLHLLLSNVLQAASEVSIIATDVDGIITLFNTGAQQMLGYKEDEVVGLATPQLFHQEKEVADRGRVLSAEVNHPVSGFRVFVSVPEALGSETREWTYVRKDGTHLTVSLVVTTMRDWTGSILGYVGIATDITEQRIQRLDLAAARDQLVLAAEAAQLGIWSWMLGDDVMDWNDRMFCLYDLPESLNHSGQLYNHWRSRVHPDDISTTETSLEAAINGQGKYNPVFRVLRPDGSIRYVQAGAYVERNAGGKATRITGINFDITERKEFESQLLQAKQYAEQASFVKSQFVANMSHEIRTPMNAVLGMLQLLRKAGLDTRQDDYASKAQTAARSLLALLNDILDFSKIDAGKLDLDLHPFSVESLMRDLAVILSGNLENKDIELLYEVEPQLPCVLIGDQLRLQQILINLAGNAMKFTREGYVLVRLTELARNQQQITLRVSVKDTGIGISPNHLTHIFEGFTQAEASITRRFGGTGLGLAISKRLVELMGGELKIESEQGHGSEFWFDLALTMADETPLLAEQKMSKPKRRILVADDNFLSGRLLAQAIEALGWEAVYVEDGRTAVEWATQPKGELFDAVIMDWRMPDLDGLAAARAIKHSIGAQKPPVIVMVTAYGREELANAIVQKDAPFEDFLTKPVTPQQLFVAIQQALGDAPQPSRVAGQPITFQLLGLRLLVVEDNELNRQIISELLTAEGARVTLAECGLEGVELATRSVGAFDAVIMDVQMPDIDGMEATRRIRSDSRFKSLPILAMTANASDSDRTDCLASGMNEHLGKPIDMAQIVPLLLRLTEKTDSSSDRTVETGEFDQDEITEPMAKVLQRMGGLREVYRTALDSFSLEGEKLLRRLEALSVDGSADEIAKALHALRGVAATLGAAALAQRAGMLENTAKASPHASGPELLSRETLNGLDKLIRYSNERLKKAFYNEVAADPKLTQ